MHKWVVITTELGGKMNFPIEMTTLHKDFVIVHLTSKVDYLFNDYRIIEV